MKENLKQIVHRLEEKQRPIETDQYVIVLLKTDNQIEQMRNQTFGRTIKETRVVASSSLLNMLMPTWNKRFQELSKRKVKIKIIVESNDSERYVKQVLERLKHGNVDLEARLVKKDVCLPYRLVDDKEAIISKKEITRIGQPKIYWTNSLNLVQFYSVNFDEEWNMPHAITVCPEDRPNNHNL
jgi:hypothetical protein